MTNDLDLLKIWFVIVIDIGALMLILLYLLFTILAYLKSIKEMPIILSTNSIEGLSRIFNGTGDTEKSALNLAQSIISKKEKTGKTYRKIFILFYFFLGLSIVMLFVDLIKIIDGAIPYMASIKFSIKERAALEGMTISGLAIGFLHINLSRFKAYEKRFKEISEMNENNSE